MTAQNEFVLKITPEMSEFFAGMKEGETALKNLVSAGKQLSDKKTMSETVSEKSVGVYNAQTQSLEKLIPTVKKYQEQVRQLDGTVNTYIVTSRKLKDGTIQVSRELKMASGSTFHLGTEMGKLAKRAALTIPVWFLLRTALMSLGRLFSESVKFMIEWEYQLAQIAIVGKTTEAEMQALSGALINLAKDFGISSSQLGEASKLWAQQGRAIGEIIPLMRTTAQLSRLTGQTTVQSVEDLTAILKAYNIEAKNSINIVDSMTNVMLNHAITAEDLASAYKQVASTASVLGVSFDSLSGYITAIKAVTRDTGSKVGLSLRTMFSRITTSSAEAIQNLASVPLYLDASGRATFAVMPRMRDLDEIISELSLKFQDLGNSQQSQLAVLVGGVRRQNQVFALFNNFTEAIKAQQDALFGLGKASTAIDTLTDTTKVKIEQLGNAWLSFIESFGDSDTFKATLTLLTRMLGGLDEIINNNKARYKESLQTLTLQNDEYARQRQFVTGIAKDMELVGQMNKISVRASKEQNDTLDERANIIRKAINDAAKLQNIDIKISATGGLQGLSDELDSVRQKVIDFDLSAIVNQEAVSLRTQVLTAGQGLGNLIDSFNKHVSRKASTKYKFESEGLDEIRQESRDVFKQILQLSQSVRKGVQVPPNVFSKFKELAKEFGKFDENQSQTLDRLIEEYQKKNDLLANESNIRDEVLKKIQEEEKYLKTIILTEEKRQIIANQVIADESARLKEAGYLTSEILKAQTYRLKQLDIEEEITDRIKRQLEYQREKNKEARLNSRLGSDSIKLFEIAQTEGVDVSKKIGDVLSGEVGFSDFVRRGGEALDVFKKEFEELFKQQQALEFFKGDRVSGLPNLRGGQQVEIEEEGIRGALLQFSASAKALVERLQQQEKDTTIGKPSVENNINVPLTFDIKLDPSNFQDLQNKFEKKMAQQISLAGSTVRKAVEQVISEF